MLVSISNTNLFAEDATVLSFPKLSSEPVVLRLSEGTADIVTDEFLQVFVGGLHQCCDGRTPVAGRTTLTNNALTFVPAFAFATGQNYVVRIRRPDRKEEFFSFNIPSEVTMVEAQVTKVYPSGNVLPENTLRFYIHFSVPMTPHVAFDYIKLRDASGVPDKAAFMKFKQELWNEDRTRLTVLIDPGRIKRDVATNRELGPALRVGQQYTLSVDGGWPSADGLSTLPAFRKSFTVGRAIRTKPNVRSWQVVPPCLETNESLIIRFDRPFDRHLINNALRVIDREGQPIDGIIKIGKEERFWHFTPSEVWTEKRIKIIANRELEDIAGNNFRELLDQVIGVQDFDPNLTTLPFYLKDCS